MARSYGRIRTSIWQNPKFRSLSEDSRIVWIYICSSPHSNAAGVFALPCGYAATDLQISSARFSEAMGELCKRGMIDQDGDFIRITDWFEHNKPTGDNDTKAIVSAINSCQSKRLMADGLIAFLELQSKLVDKVRDDCEALLSRVLKFSSDNSRIVGAEMDMDMDMDMEPDMEPEPDSIPPDGGPPAECEEDEIGLALDAYRVVAADTGLPIPKGTARQRKLVASRLKSHGAASWAIMLDKIRGSPFLKDRTKWSGATLDWCCNLTNFEKIIEGNYDVSTSGGAAEQWLADAQQGLREELERRANEGCNAAH